MSNKRWMRDTVNSLCAGLIAVHVILSREHWLNAVLCALLAFPLGMSHMRFLLARKGAAGDPTTRSD